MQLKDWYGERLCNCYEMLQFCLASALLYTAKIPRGRAVSGRRSEMERQGGAGCVSRNELE